MKELIRQKATDSALRRAAAVAGTKTLLEDGIDKACQGTTNPEELFRVIEITADETFPCPKCGSAVNREIKSCPFCAYTLRNICQACGQDLNAEWTLCPYCSAPAGTQGAADAGTKAPEDGPHLLPTSSADSDGRRQIASLPAAMLPETKHPKIVVADDDENILKVVAAALRKLPIEVEIFTAHDGINALEIIESKGADLLILDLKMPGMDGFAVCEKLRVDIRTAFLPILMLTANSDQENRTKGYLIGTDDFMSKPFAVPEFLARVTRLLRRTYGV
jgi:CheY-like chemotaxis protein/rRNA maturation protein Nop10